MKNLLKSAIIVATGFGMNIAVAQDEEEQNCDSVASAISSAIAADQSEVLNVLSEQLGSSPGCACEGVKSAIQASEADKALVGSIVEAGITAIPAQADMIADCATAEAPDAAAEINAAYEKVTGKTRSSGQNPLDFPGDTEGGINGDDLNSGGGAGDGSLTGLGASFVQPNLVSTPPTPSVTDPNP